MESFTKKVWWLAAAIWAVVIFDLSRAPYSSASSSRSISIVLRWLSISISPQNLALLNSLLRESAHLAEYAILAMLLYNSLKPVGDAAWSRNAAFWSLLASGSYSLTDEFHQLFIPGRHASIFDCLTDMTGALLGLLVLSAALTVLRRLHAATVAQTPEGPFMKWGETPR